MRKLLAFLLCLWLTPALSQSPASPTMLSGNTNGSVPAASTGNEGNYFFDLSTGQIWGPKSFGVWPSPSTPLPSLSPYSVITSPSSYFPQFILMNTTADSSGPYFITQKSRGGGPDQVGDSLGSYATAGTDATGVMRGGPYLAATLAQSVAGSIPSNFYLNNAGTYAGLRYDGYFVVPYGLMLGSAVGAPYINTMAYGANPGTPLIVQSINGQVASSFASRTSDLGTLGAGNSLSETTPLNTFAWSDNATTYTSGPYAGQYAPAWGSYGQCIRVYGQCLVHEGDAINAGATVSLDSYAHVYDANPSVNDWMASGGGCYGTVLQTTASTASGSNVLNVVSTWVHPEGVIAGSGVAASTVGIPAGDTIASFTTNTSITLSANVTATIPSGTSLYVGAPCKNSAGVPTYVAGTASLPWMMVANANGVPGQGDYDQGPRISYNAIHGNDGKTASVTVPAFSVAAGDAFFWDRCDNTTNYPANCTRALHGAEIVSHIVGTSPGVEINFAANSSISFEPCCDTTAWWARIQNGHISGGSNLISSITCGTGATVSGNDIHGTITTGTGTFTTCTISWVLGRSAAPDAHVSSPSGSAWTGYTPSTTGLVISNSANFAAGAKYTYDAWGL